MRVEATLGFATAAVVSNAMARLRSVRAGCRSPASVWAVVATIGAG
jgi:hypothetical protein